MVGRIVFEYGSRHVVFAHEGFWVIDEDAEANPIEGFQSEDYRLAYRLAVSACKPDNDPRPNRRVPLMFR